MHPEIGSSPLMGEDKAGADRDSPYPPPLGSEAARNRGIRGGCHSERSEESNHSTESIAEILRPRPQNDIARQPEARKTNLLMGP